MKKTQQEQPWIARQGDVLLIRVASIPAAAAPIERDQQRIVLAYGEVTGHSHQILERDAELLSVSDQVDRWLRIGNGGARVVHEEHGTIELPPGGYRVRIQREYAPESIRDVRD